MSYPNGKSSWKKIMDNIKKENKRKKKMINDPTTPNAQRNALIFEDINATFPEVKRKDRRKNRRKK